MADLVHDPESLAPRPGGMRRFIIAAVITVAVLVGVVVGMLYWMSVTARHDYNGPPELKYPEHRPFR